MITLQHKAIICVSENLDRLRTLERLLGDNFGTAYVIEIAENSIEVENIIATLSDIGVETGVLLTDYRIDDMSGLELIHQINHRYKGIKTMLMTEAADIDFAQKLVNQNDVYALIKLPLNVNHFLQLVGNACHQFATDRELEQIIQKLRMSEKEKSLILESIAESIVYVDMNSQILWKNRVADEELFDGITDGKEQSDILMGLCKECPFDMIFLRGEVVSFEVQIKKRWKLARYFPVYDRDRLPVGLVITLLDITRQKKALDMNETLLEMSRYINHGDSMVLMYNKAYHLINRHFEVKLMCIIGEDFDNDYMEFYGNREKYLSEFQVESLIRSVKRIQANNREDESITMPSELGTLMAYPMNGKMLLLLLGGTIMQGDEGFGFLNILSEHLKMGMLKIENYRKIVYQANHDSLTGLFSRAYFLSRLKNHLDSHRHDREEPGYFTLAVMDLNFFKDINDNYSHLVGDEVLLEIAQRLKYACREGDVVARIGGDEFAILFRTGNRKEIITMIQRLQEEIAAPIKVDDIGVAIGSSFGIVHDVKGYGSVEKLLNDADQAMYEAKKDKSGHGRFVFYETGIQSRVERALQIEHAIKTSDLDRTLSLAFQPIVDLKQMTVVGYEGYLRWTTSEGERIRPDELLKIAADSGDILRIGNKIIGLAMDSFDRLDRNQDHYLTINISNRELIDDNHIHDMKKAIIDHQIPSNRLHLDINDRYNESQIGRIARNVQDLRDFGVRIELDDYGSDTAALGTISRIGIDELKINRDTVNSVRFNTAAVKMVRSIVSIAKTMDMKVTAEGVEKAEDIRILRELGCDYAQGFYFMEPGSLEDALAYTPTIMI